MTITIMYVVSGSAESPFAIFATSTIRRSMSVPFGGVFPCMLSMQSPVLFPKTDTVKLT